MANSDGIVLEYRNKELTTLPIDDLDWSRATLLLLEGNKIKSLDASLLPRTLTYLDMTDNPLTEISGTLPNLTNLILSGTQIKKLPRLPETLTEIDIHDTPFYDINGIRDLEEIKRYSDWPLDIYDIVLDRSPEVSVSYNSNSNSNLLTNSTTNQHLMVLERIDTENDIQYKVQTLTGATKILSKHLLEPYIPAFATMVTPIPAGPEKPNVYLLEGHGEDILFIKPVPPGCVYVTIEECGVLSADWFKLLYAFEDKPPGIREKLRDPIKHRVELMIHFGRSFHVHYAEAKLEGDRTYVEHINSPFTGWNRSKCYIGKSGIYNLDDGTEFTNPSIDHSKPDIEKLTKVVNCESVLNTDFDFIFSGSLYPTRKMVDTLVYDKIIPYRELDHIMDYFQYSQSWAFKMFPGVHYNFSCRGITKHDKKNERISRRKHLSLEGPTRNIEGIPEDQIRGPTGIQLLNEAIKVKNMNLVKALVGRGVNINKSALETAIDTLNNEALEFFLTVPGVDTAKASRAVDEKTEEIQANILFSKEDKILIISTLEDIKSTIKSHIIKGHKRNKKTRHRKTGFRKTHKVHRKRHI